MMIPFRNLDFAVIKLKIFIIDLQFESIDKKMMHFTDSFSRYFSSQLKQTFEY